MANDILTFGLEGEVTLDDFAIALHNFNALLNELSKEVAQSANIAWVIEELHAGSAVATFRGDYGQTDIVEHVVSAYETVGESLQAGKEIPYSANVKKYALNLTDLLNGKITAIRIETPSKDFMVSGKVLDGEKTSPMKYSLGIVKGVVQTLSMRKKLYFTLWDTLFDKPVSCYLKAGEEENMRSVWGRRALISGKIGRQSATGRPVVVREVSSIEILKEILPGSYKRARGVIPWSSDSALPEQIIRRLRDA